MSRVSVDQFVVGVNSICTQKPKFKMGHDGSSGNCDAIGLVRGGLLRSGATKVIGMKEPNQCVRFVIGCVNPINVGTLKRGDIVFKTCDIDDSFMPLPTKYRIGGQNYNGDLNNYCDVGVVVKENPLEIVHMTSKGIQKDKKAKNWDFVGWLPYVMEERCVVHMSNAVIHSNGIAVKVYAQPTFGCKEYIEINDGSDISILDKSNNWCFISFQDGKGYVLNKYVEEVAEKEEIKETLTSADIDKLKEAYEIIGNILGAYCKDEKKKRRWFK